MKRGLFYDDIHTRSSTGRRDTCFSSLSVIDKWAIHIADFIRTDYTANTYIDHSAGDNEMVKALRKYLPHLTYQAYDLVPRDDDVTKQDWLDVQPTDNIIGKCVIGFNPPFGFRSTLARKFLIHAATFKPRRIYSILPRSALGVRIPNMRPAKDAPVFLAPCSSFRTPDNVVVPHYGMAVMWWDYEEGFMLPKPIKYPCPEHILLRQSKETWYQPSTLFIRRVGANPGMKLVWCHSDGETLSMLDPNGRWTLDVTPAGIKNSITCYNDIKPIHPARWVEGDIETRLRKMQEDVITFQIKRNEYHIPILSREQLVWLATRRISPL